MRTKHHELTAPSSHAPLTLLSRSSHAPLALCTYPPPPQANVGAKLIQEVAQKSDSKAGDGTTTSTIMTQEIVNQGMRAVTAGVNPVALNLGIRKSARLLAEEVERLARPVKTIDDLRDIATIASGSVEVSDLLPIRNPSLP